MLGIRNPALPKSSKHDSHLYNVTEESYNVQRKDESNLKFLHQFVPNIHSALPIGPVWFVISLRKEGISMIF